MSSMGGTVAMCLGGVMEGQGKGLGCVPVLHLYAHHTHTVQACHHARGQHQQHNECEADHQSSVCPGSCHGAARPLRAAVAAGVLCRRLDVADGRAMRRPPQLLPDLEVVEEEATVGVSIDPIRLGIRLGVPRLVCRCSAVATARVSASVGDDERCASLE